MPESWERDSQVLIEPGDLRCLISVFNAESLGDFLLIALLSGGFSNGQVSVCCFAIGDDKVDNRA